MDTLLNDIRYAVRTLRRSPLFTVIAVATLGLGIGANVSLFSVVNGVVLRPLTLAQPERLVLVGADNAKRNAYGVAVTGPDFAAWRRENRTFESIAASTERNVELTGRGEPAEINGEIVSREFFSVLPARPLAGRMFVDADFASRDAGVALISESLWRGRFGSDRGVIGQRVTVDGTPRTIIGVVPAASQWPAYGEIFFTLPDTFDAMDVSVHMFQVVGRLRPGVTLEQARTDLRAIGARVEERRPQVARGWTANLIRMDDWVVGKAKRSLLLLLGAVGFVLLLVCANIAGLQLARATARAPEIAVRCALGASRQRIVRQLLVESGVIAAAGGALGFLMALWGVDLVRSLGPDAIPRLDEVRVDAAALAFAVAASAVAALLCGLAPAMVGSRTGVHSVLKESARGAVGRRGPGVRMALVVGEVALALVLLVGAGLMVKSFGRLRSIALGYDPRNALDVDIDLPNTRYAKPENRTQFVRQAEQRLRALPGVVSVGSTRALPLESGGPDVQFSIAGQPAAEPGEARPWAFFTSVTPGYFGAMRVRIVRGRGLSDADDVEGVPLVVVINETMARRFWPSADPIGQRLMLADGRAADIIGVVADVRQRFLTNALQPSMFVPYSRAPQLSVSIVVRTDGPPDGLVAAIHREVWAVDPQLPVEQWTFDELLGGATASARFQTLLLGAFAVVALLVAVIGVYAVVSYGVTMRTREIGLRMALGAARRDVVRLVLGQGASLAAFGVVLGLIGAIVLTRLMSGMLYEVSATDPLTLGVAAVALGLVAVAATYLPARRAAAVDPMVALRGE